MLVLGRKPRESLILKTESGDVIEIMLVRQKGNGVRIGIQAPKSVTIYRKEVYVALKQGTTGSCSGVATGIQWGGDAGEKQ